MNIRGVNGINFTPYPNLEKFKPDNKEKIKAEPTEEQLKHIEESMEREKEWLANDENNEIVPIDWEYVKETINLSPEELEIRAMQDKKELDDHYDAEMREIDRVYRENMDKIDARGKLEQENIDAKNMYKAMAIVQQVASGKILSPFDIEFARDVLPKELAEAERQGRERESSKSAIDILLNNIDMFG